MTQHVVMGLQYRLFEVISSVGRIVKSEKARIPTKGGSGYEYSYASLESVMDILKPELAKSGLSYYFGAPCFDPSGNLPVVRMTAYLACPETNEVLSYDACIPCAPDAQGMGSGVTYLRRYTTYNIFQLVPEDDDGAQATSSMRAYQPKMQQASAQKPAENVESEPPRTSRQYPQDGEESVADLWQKVVRNGNPKLAALAWVKTKQLVGDDKFFALIKEKGIPNTKNASPDAVRAAATMYLQIVQEFESPNDEGGTEGVWTGEDPAW